MSWLYLWVDAGNDPDFNRGDANGITGYFLPLGDARTTKAQLQSIAGKPRANGVYVGQNWWPTLTAKEYVAKANALLNPIRLSTTRVQFNLEQHDPAYILDVFEGFRVLNPKVGLSWALEGFQGGWIRDAEATMQFVTRMVKAKVRVVPEVFAGKMADITLRSSDPAGFLKQLNASLRPGDAVLQDLLAAGFPKESINVFLDGAFIGREASGYVFTQGRLPA